MKQSTNLSILKVILLFAMTSCGPYGDKNAAVKKENSMAVTDSLNNISANKFKTIADVVSPNGISIWSKGT